MRKTKCPNCNGRGKVEILEAVWNKGTDYADTYTTTRPHECPVCGGSGSFPNKHQQ